MCTGATHYFCFKIPQLFRSRDHYSVLENYIDNKIKNKISAVCVFLSAVRRVYVQINEDTLNIDHLISIIHVD